jgi:hypothetical protein
MESMAGLLRYNDLHLGVGNLFRRVYWFRSEYLRCRQIATGILEILIWQAEQVARSASFVPKAVFPEGVEEALTRLLEDECHRLGAMIEQVDIRPQILELQSRPLGIPLERDSKVASEVERLVRWIHAFWEYRDGKTR